MSKQALNTHQLVAFAAGTLTKPAEGRELPSRLLICPWGTHDTGKGVVTCNATTAGLLLRNQAATKRLKVALDFQHNSVETSKTYTGEPLKVAAYGALELVEGEGIYLSALEWTPEGKDHAANGHYPDISPALKLNDQREVIWVHSAGLVRQGEIDGLELFDAGDTINAVLNMGLDTGMMNWTASRELLNIFLATVGMEIPDNATYDETKSLAARGAKKLEAGMATPEAKAAAAATDNPDTNTDTDTEITTMNADEINQLKTRLERAEQRADKADKDAIQAKAIAAGKVIPLSAEDIAGFSVEQFSAICDRLPAGQVRMESRGDGQVKSETLTFAANTELAATLSRMGITQEEFEQYGPKA